MPNTYSIFEKVDNEATIKFPFPQVGSITILGLTALFDKNEVTFFAKSSLV